ncbi:MAG: XRE family transcriptional regulator [Faecalibacterium sp.]
MDIGHKIKRLRIQKGLTLEELASRSELTKGFLSQMERNLTSPSIATLDDILEALGTTLGDFFKEEKEEQLVFPQKDFFVDEREGCTVHWIVPNTQKNDMEPILMELPQGGQSFMVEPHGGEEFGYVLEGSIILTSGDESKRYKVNKGETFYLFGKNAHYLKNEKKTTAKVLWVSTPPLF